MEANKTKLSFLTILFGIIVTLAGLALLAYIGIYNRYWGDDWCYNSDFKTLGIADTIGTYFMTGEEALRGYANNRYSLTLISGLLYLTGIFGAKITATLVITSWLVGCYWLLSNIQKLFKITSEGTAFLSVAIIIYYTLYISPQRFQVLYWTAGIHYSLAIISGIFLLALITSQAIRETKNKYIDYIVIPLAFLAGGFSEIGNAFLLTVFALTLVIVWYFKRSKEGWAEKAFSTTLITFITLLISLLVLVLAPSNEARTAVISAERTELLTAIFLSFRFAFDFILDSVRSLPLPHLVFCAVFFCLPILSANKSTPNFLRTILLILLVAITLWVVISAIQAPSVLFYAAPPDPRGKSLARFTMFIGLAVITWLLGKDFSARWNNKFTLFASILALLAFSAYTAYTMTRIYSEIPSFVHRAELWDMRDSQIQQAVKEGQTLAEVIVIDMQGLGVKDIMSSSQMNGEWVSTCSSNYYGFEAIKAIAP